MREIIVGPLESERETRHGPRTVRGYDGGGQEKPGRRQHRRSRGSTHRRSSA
ncbi:hypothetical protein PLANPX_0342 [Lacipirellula parvula]|uniref:Uncharacterized protein n=1 Tax=Lacipirellula parvula TaxID=2650471 RepID=A0A5K7X2M7_9BACT|nr:hypothetical protein PLANPX_0342 [Lacipirellula parvula]